MDRFARTEQLLGKKFLEKIKKAKVAVFGLGAVGSFAVESLVRCGAENFILVDFDEVRLTNFNRQILALESTVGKLKTETARERILEINPACKIITHPVFACPENLGSLLTPRPDVVIDAIDSLNPKTELISFCVSANIPIISSMGAGQRTDPFSIKTGDISQTLICPLAKRLKKRLKKRGVCGGVRCVYSTEPPIKNHPVKEEEEFYQRGRKRKPVGGIFYITAMFGLVMSYEAINPTSTTIFHNLLQCKEITFLHPIFHHYIFEFGLTFHRPNGSCLIFNAL